MQGKECCEPVLCRRLWAICLDPLSTARVQSRLAAGWQILICFFIFLEEKKREDYENIVCEPSTFAVDLCTPNASRSIFPQLSLFWNHPRSAPRVHLSSW